MRSPAKRPSSQSTSFVVRTDSAATSASDCDSRKTVCLSTDLIARLQRRQTVATVARRANEQRRLEWQCLLEGEIHVGARLVAQTGASDVADDADDLQRLRSHYDLLSDRRTRSGNNRFASASLTMATRGPSGRSRSSNTRPATSGMPSALKKPPDASLPADLRRSLAGGQRVARRARTAPSSCCR